MADQNGTPPSGPGGLLGAFSDKEIAQLKAAATEQAVGQLMGLVTALMPTVSPAIVEGVIRGVLKQQEHADFTRILDDASDPKARAEHPVWGVMLHVRGAKQGSKPALIVRIPKDPSTIKTADAALQYVTVLGLITNPLSRAALLLMGYEPHFVQAKTPPLVSLT